MSEPTNWVERPDHAKLDLHAAVETFGIEEREAAVQPLLLTFARLRDQIKRHTGVEPAQSDRDQVAHQVLLGVIDTIEITLAAYGVAVEVPQLGDPFDSRRHQTVASTPTDDVGLVGKIAEVRRDGYRDNRRGRQLVAAEVSLHVPAPRQASYTAHVSPSGPSSGQPALSVGGIFGIDLGTTYSVISYIDDSGKPVVVRDMMYNQDTVPSVVYFEDESNFMVGRAAKELAVIDPDHAVSMVKRQMGNADWVTTQFGKDYKAPAISALILKQLASIAEAETGKKVENVVITVPAYFLMVERAATKQAGEIAGLEVVAVVGEPVAAAFSYGIGSGANDKTIFVFDLGGGTFDVTLIELTSDSIDVVVVDGDHELGGRDWDEALFGHLSEKVISDLGEPDLLEDGYFLQDLWNKAEEMKMRLSDKDAVSGVFRGSDAGVKVTVTRAEFEQMTAHLIEKTVEITKRCLATAEGRQPGVTAKISDVLLVGGSSLMPIVAATLKREFGWEPQLADPHLAVAKGAALYHGRLVSQPVRVVSPATGGFTVGCWSI